MPLLDKLIAKLGFCSSNLDSILWIGHGCSGCDRHVEWQIDHFQPEYCTETDLNVGLLYKARLGSLALDFQFLKESERALFEQRMDGYVSDRSLDLDY